MKKILAIFVAAMMIFALCATSFAAPADLTGHTYTAYQILKGTQNENPDLADIKWGEGITYADFLSDLKASADFGNTNPFTACNSADDVAAIIKNWNDDSNNAKALAKIALDNIAGDGVAVENGVTEIDAGYYLVVDTTTAEKDIYNLALLQQTKKGTFTIASKVDVPTVTKKLSDKSGLTCQETADNHVHGKACYNWADANTAAIGDTVVYDITGTVPAAVADYDYYYYIIEDTLSNGLTYTEDSMTVTIGGVAAAEGTDYSVIISGNTFKVALHNAKAHAGDVVDVIYKATLNENAVIGTDGNENEVIISYSSKPDFKYNGTKNPTTSYTPGEEGEPEDGEKPGFPLPDVTSPIPFGETSKDVTLTFVTALKLYKVDQDNAPLSGAKFKLTGAGLNTVLVAKDTYTLNAGGAYWKLANGSYTKTAPIINDTMTPAEEGATEGYVVAEQGFVGDKVNVGGVDYRAYNSQTDSGMDIFTLTESNAALYNSTTDKYKKTITLTDTVNETSTGVTAEVDELGIVIFKGLNAGEYTLSEVVTPEGYNSIEDITFEITCTLPTSVLTGEEVCTWSAGNNVTYNADNDAFELTIVNQKGSVLPETGGIGTTIFYVIGAILVLGAVVFLVVKKRMDTEN